LSCSSGAARANDVASAQKCTAEHRGITLSPGFCAGIFADNIGYARHMTVANDGTLYVNTWSGRYFGKDAPPPGGFIIVLKDTNGAVTLRGRE
jgi:hypothetical protein